MQFEEFKSMANLRRVKCCWNCRFLDGRETASVCEKSGYPVNSRDDICDLHEGRKSGYEADDSI
jgi:hypothetical protein